MSIRLKSLKGYPNTFVFCLTILLAVFGCNFQEGNRSGDLHDDYIEEPISERSKKYQNALDVSNRVLELMAAHRAVGWADFKKPNNNG